MNESRSRNVSPGVGATAGAAGGGRRGLVVVGVALVVCAAIGAGIVAANRGDGGAPDTTAKATPGDAGPGRPATGVATAGPKPAAGATAVETTPPDAPPTPEVREKVKTVLQETEALDRTVFAREVEAQEYEEYFIRLWDQFRAEKDKLGLLERAAAFETLKFAAPGTPARHDWGVSVTKHDGATQSLDPVGWRSLAARLREAGYAATEIEFHQSEFVHDPGKPARSTVSTLLHLVNDAASSRQVLRAKLKVEWSEKADVELGMFVPRTIEATDLTIAERVGEVTFEPAELPGGNKREGLFLPGAYSGFVLAYDLDGDGRSEILVPGENMLYRNRGGWRFEREQLLPGSRLGELGGGVIADFTGDGLPDLLCTKNDRVFLVRGIAGGRFSTSPPEQAVELSFPVQAVAAMTAGDIDGDGDLDAWIGQYKPPYTKGQMPTPYYDANDGHPAALLLNGGGGKFTDGTDAAGLGTKRLRRTFAASFIDLDNDRDLDVLVNSDFSGLDIYYNDGKGRFADVTDQVVNERHNFGMGHTFADFNLDGALDMYTIGMSSTTARRLTAMGAGREEFPEYQEKRPQMGYGNRMFFAPPDAPPGEPARYEQPAFRDDVARTGWSWGAASPDFDNDGDPDIYVANGHKSGDTCRDYCTTYWRRDIYLGNSKEDPVMKNLFDEVGIPDEMSWNGFEHNVLFMNQGGKGFLNVAHLMGVAFEFDARNVIADDLDGDGKVDLLVVEKRLPSKGRYLHVLKNNWPTKYNWVGVRLAETRPGFSPIGATVRVRTAGGRVQIARVVAGDSIHSQHANAKHFGLGDGDKVESIEVTWPNGQTTEVANPDVNKWHDLRPTPATAAAR